MKKGKTALAALFAAAALLCAGGGVLYSRAAPARKITEALQSTVAANALRSEALRRDYPVLGSLDAFTSGSAAFTGDAAFLEAQGVPLAPLVNAVLAKAHAEAALVRDTESHSQSASLGVTLPGGALVRAEVFSAPGQLCLALPDFTDTVVSAPPERFADAWLASNTGASSPPSRLPGVLAAALARPDATTRARLGDGLVDIAASLLAKAELSEPQSGLYHIALDGETGRQAALDLLGLLSSEGVLSGEPLDALSGFLTQLDALSLDAELTLSGGLLDTLRATARFSQNRASAGELLLNFQDRGGAQSLTLDFTDKSDETSHLLIGRSSVEEDGRVSQSLSLSASDGGEASGLVLSLGAGRDDALSLSASLTLPGKPPVLLAADATLRAEGEVLRLEAPEARLSSEGWGGTLLWRVALTRAPLAAPPSPPAATELDAMSEEQRQTLFEQYRDGLRQTAGKMAGGILFG